MRTYTIKEAMELTGLSDSTFRRYMKKGVLPTKQLYGVYTFTEDDLKRIPWKVIPSQMNTTDNTSDTSLDMSVVSTPNTTLHQLLEDINAGYNNIAVGHERIADRYQETVKPLINHYINTEHQSFANLFAQFTQQLINNMLVYMSTNHDPNTSPEELVSIMLRGLDLPQELLQIAIDNAKKLMEMHKSQVVSA